jgi:hypothetical protein
MDNWICKICGKKIGWCCRILGMFDFLEIFCLGWYQQDDGKVHQRCHNKKNKPKIKIRPLIPKFV